MRHLAHRVATQPARPRRSGAGAAPDAAVAAVLGLQRGAGNAAVTGLIRASRRAIQRQPKTHTFELGKDVSVDLAKHAKGLAKDGTVTPDELPALHALALKDETVGDAERMFMAGLLDPANAALLAAADIKTGSKLTFTFASATTGANLRTAADVGRETAASGLTKDAATKKLLALVGASRARRMQAVLAFGPPRTRTGPVGVLPAMLAAASDSTPDDMLAAATVYTVAASAKHRSPPTYARATSRWTPSRRWPRARATRARRSTRPTGRAPARRATRSTSSPRSTSRTSTTARW
jgi:hypothetical protein